MLGALDGDDKMAKSRPDSAIFMEDTAADVVRKIKVCDRDAQQVTVRITQWSSRYVVSLVAARFLPTTSTPS